MEPDLIPYSASSGIAASSVLVLAPHADDEVFGCGGALALHAAAGTRIHIIILTADADASTASVRAAESSAAARLMGHAEPVFWNVPDRSLACSESLVQQLQAAIVEAGADLVYAPSPYEVHPDHRQASVIASQAVARHGGPLRVAFYEVGSPLRPNVLVDITPVLARKRRAMRCFASQLAQQDYLRHVSALNTYRTYTLPPHVEAAEAFWLVDAADIADGVLARSALPIVSPGLGPAAREAGHADWPLVSVLVRSMDRPWLSQALDSIALQTYPRIEVVVAAATPDHAGLPAWCGPFPLRLVPTDRPLARSAAANHALDAAHGDLLLLLDDDDWLLPSHIARLAGLLRHLPGTRAAYTGVDLVDADNRPKGQALDLPWDRIRQMAGNLTPIHAVLFDAALVRTQRCRFDESLDQYEDWDFWLQIARHTVPAHLPGSSAVYRVHQSSGVHDDAGPRSAAAATVYEKWQPQWSPEDRGALMERIWSLADTENACAQAQEYAAQQKADAERIRAYADETDRRHEERQRRHYVEAERLRAALLSMDDARARSHAVALASARDETDRLQRATDSHIANLMQALSDKDVHIGNLESALAATREHGAQLVSAKDVHIANLEAVLAQRDHALQDAAVHAASVETLAVAVARVEPLRALRSRLGRLARAIGGTAATPHRPPVTIDSASTAPDETDNEAPPAAAAEPATAEPAVALPIAEAAVAAGESADTAVAASAMSADRAEVRPNPAEDSAANPPAPAAHSDDYQSWSVQHGARSAAELDALRAEAEGWEDKPLISVVMPVYNPPLDLLREAIASVQQQVYGHWELCIADDASSDGAVWTLLEALAESDSRIKAVRRPANGHISEASNSALALATGDFVALLDNDDLLPPDALFCIAETVRTRPTVQVIYTDEDKLDTLGRHFGPYFKPDWNYTLFLGHNLISHLGVYRRELLTAAGGFRKGLEGSQDYDLALRCIERVDAADIVHIPRVLYHWRAIEGSTALTTEAKPYTLHAAQQALEEHLQRTGRGGTVEILATSNYRTTPADVPACDDVSLIVLGGTPSAAPAWAADVGYGIREVLFSPGDAAATAEAVAQARGALVALVHAEARPADVRALRDLACFAASPGVAAAAGTLRDPAGRLERGAFVLGPQGGIAVAHGGLPRDHGGYMGRALLAQDMSGLEPGCVVLSRAALDTVGPLAADAGSLVLALLAWNLQALDRGLRNVWLPAAEWRIPQQAADALAVALGEELAAPGLAQLRERHASRFARDPAYHPFLDATRADFALRLPLRP